MVNYSLTGLEMAAKLKHRVCVNPLGDQKMLPIGSIRAGARLIAAFSSLALAGAALAGEATREYYESLKPGRQLAKQCFNEFGQLVLTPKNIGLCADLPKAAVLGFDITPRQELARECYDGDGQLVITPRNVDLCASLPTAAIIAIPSEPADGDDGGEPSSQDVASATNTDGGTDGTDGSDGSDGTGGTDGTDGDGDNGHGNDSGGADSSNPGNGPKN
jgi:hypothetical protein